MAYCIGGRKDNYIILCSGIGVSAGSVLFGELARTTTKKERTAVFSLFMATRQIGLVIGKCICVYRFSICLSICIYVTIYSLSGPAFNLFLRICNFNLGPFTVDKFTSPAVSCFHKLVYL